MITIFRADDKEHYVEIPDETQLLAYRGSIAHNMYVPNTDPNSIDDIDLLAVVVAPPEHYLGLSDWGSRGTKEIKEGKYDVVLYELKKMVRLLLQGNPNVLSILFLRKDHYLFEGPVGKGLLSIRDKFIGKHVYHSFAGYASQQLQKMETRDPAELRKYMALTYEAKSRGIHPNERGVKTPYPADYNYSSSEGYNAACHNDEALLRNLSAYIKKGENIGYLGDKRKNLVLEHGYDSKNAAHCIRLLRMCKEFLTTGTMKVYRDDDSAELLDIKRGLWKLDLIKDYANFLFKECREAYESSTLPPEPDRDGVERWLVETLRSTLTKEK